MIMGDTCTRACAFCNVKTGLPGVGYVRFDKSAAWPANLQPKAAIPANLWNPTGSSGTRP